MWAQLTRACLRLEEIETQLSQPETYDDPDLAASLNKEQKDLLPLVEAVSYTHLTLPTKA